MNAHALFSLFVAWAGWAIGFLLLYSAQAIGCRMGWDEVMIGWISTLRLVLVSTTMAVVLVLIGLSWRTVRNAGALSLARIGALANGAAVLATLCFGGVLWLSMCT
jgi:hypothetical protein